MNNPRILVRPDDKEEFIEVRHGMFSNKKLVEQFPDNEHIEWSYMTLIDNGFALKKIIEVEEYYIEAYPETIWYITSEIPGRKIMITEDPYEGLNTKYIKTNG